MHVKFGLVWFEKKEDSLPSNSNLTYVGFLTSFATRAWSNCCIIFNGNILGVRMLKASGIKKTTPSYWLVILG